MTDSKRVLDVGGSMFRRRMNGETIVCSNSVEIDVRALTETEWVYVSSQAPAAMPFVAFRIGVSDIRGLEDENGEAVKFVKGKTPNPLGRGSIELLDQSISDGLNPMVKTRVAEVILELSGLTEDEMAKVHFTSPSSETSS